MDQSDEAPQAKCSGRSLNFSADQDIESLLTLKLALTHASK